MDMYKCEVVASKIMLEVFDNKGNVKTIKTTDTNGRPNVKPQQHMIRKGDIVALPMDKITALGNSVKIVMAPVAAVMEEDDDAPEDKGTKEKTVAAQIPKK